MAMIELTDGQLREASLLLEYAGQHEVSRLLGMIESDRVGLVEWHSPDDEPCYGTDLIGKFEDASPHARSSRYTCKDTYYDLLAHEWMPAPSGYRLVAWAYYPEQIGKETSV